jgi:hypothetical protein
MRMALTPERMAAARASGSTRMAGNRWPACALAGAAAGVGVGVGGGASAYPSPVA